jgi:hypothetical protein
MSARRAHAEVHTVLHNCETFFFEVAAANLTDFT